MRRKQAREGIEQGAAYPEWVFISNRPTLRFLYRFLLGRPMDGQRWTDSTFWRSATRGEDQGWLRLAGWHRSLIRCTAAYVLLLLIPALTLLRFVFGSSAALQLFGAHLILWSTIAAPIIVYKLIRSRGLTLPLPSKAVDAERGARWIWSRTVLIHGRREWLLTKLIPVGRVAAPLLQRRFHPREVAQWISVPRDYREHGAAPVEILLPQSFAAQARAQATLIKSVGERLGMRDPVARWELEGNAPRLLLSAPVLPPDLVRPADCMLELERSEPYTFVLGRSGSEVLTVSLREDSPHIAVSAGSGAGKSEQMKGLIAQALHWGWSILILDWKGESQEWAEGLPGVRYVRQIDALHDMMVSIGEEIEKRRLLRDKAARDALPRVLVISEEWSITAPLLQSYWSELRSLAEPEERRTMPLKSPAIEAGMKLNFTGRSLGFCQLLVAIRFSARVTNGNADLRESFGFVLMSRWKAQTVKMLAPDIKPFPKKITTPGRWVAVNGDEAVIFQAILWSDEEARKWATSGTFPPHSPWSLGGVAERLSQQAGELLSVASTLGEVAATVAARHNPASQPRPPQLRKLTELADSLEPLGFTHQMLRKAARADGQGDPDFPSAEGGNQFSGYLYDVQKVRTYARNKRAVEAVEKGKKNG